MADEDLVELFNLHEEEQPEPEHPFVNIMGFNIRLLNKHHSLWGDLVWSAGKIVARCINEKAYDFDVANKTVVEFGAGCALCSLVCATNAAANVVTTDYPDNNIVENLIYNTQKYSNISVVGHQWGKDTTDIINANNGKQFDIAILCDLIFNITEHRALLRSLTSCLKRDGYAIVSYTHHRVRHMNDDLNFFRYAESEFGMKVDELFTEKHPPMFKDDYGDVEIRSTCHVCKLTYK